jgi:hypothetical protein
MRRCKRFFLILILFLFKMNIFIFSDCFDVLMLKINFFKKKQYFNVFLSEKHFELPSLPQFQTGHY